MQRPTQLLEPNLSSHHHQHQLLDDRWTSATSCAEQWRQPSLELAAPELRPLTKFALDFALGPMRQLDASIDYATSGLWREGADERTSRLPLLTGAPWKLVGATLVYLYLIKRALPRLMRDRPALELQWPIRAYNLLMVVGNMYAFFHGSRILNFGAKCFGCEVINHADYSPAAIELLHYGWLFMVSRLVEWLDTIFFVLRKKHNQVSKLHVFHHSFVPLLCWLYIKYHPGYTVAFFPYVNSLVHTIMYSYYLLATFGPKMEPYLWWKKYLTSMQILQFVLIIIQLATIPLSASAQCQYPRAFLYVAFAGAILFLWLFYTYYLDTYRGRGRPKQRQAAPAGKPSLPAAAKLGVAAAKPRREGHSDSLARMVDYSIMAEAH